MFGAYGHAPELIILLVIALIIFGPKKLPSLGKGIGDGIRELRKATAGEGEKDETKDAAGEAVTAAAAAAPPVAEAPKSSTDTTSAGVAKPPRPAAATPAPDHKP